MEPFIFIFGGIGLMITAGMYFVWIRPDGYAKRGEAGVARLHRERMQAAAYQKQINEGRADNRLEHIRSNRRRRAAF